MDVEFSCGFICWLMLMTVVGYWMNIYVYIFTLYKWVGFILKSSCSFFILLYNYVWDISILDKSSVCPIEGRMENSTMVPLSWWWTLYSVLELKAVPFDVIYTFLLLIVLIHSLSVIHLIKLVIVTSLT